METIRSHSEPTIQDVRSYWNNHPLFSHELDEPGLADYFRNLDHIKKADVERFAMDFWKFDRFVNKRVWMRLRSRMDNSSICWPRCNRGQR